ncbi:MAG: TIGR03915 family putative DNA repair protein, partial [Phycisphaerae bacterium]
MLRNMQTRQIQPTFEAWRDAARTLLREGVAPQHVVWVEAGVGGLFPLAADVPAEPAKPANPAEHHVPPSFLQLARLVACYRDERRWALCYRLLWRLTHGQRHVLKLATDDDVLAANRMAKAVRRDRHKMHAFVRFRKVTDDAGEHFVAWHRPDHLIVPLAAPFFADRFGGMRWTILTPDASVAWDGHALAFGPG